VEHASEGSRRPLIFFSIVWVWVVSIVCVRGKQREWRVDTSRTPMHGCMVVLIVAYADLAFDS